MNTLARASKLIVGLEMIPALFPKLFFDFIAGGVSCFVFVDEIHI